jgi:hypothetical protein
MLAVGALREIEMEDEKQERLKREETASRSRSRKGPLIIELDSDSELDWEDRSLAKETTAHSPNDTQSLLWSFARSMESIQSVLEDLKTVCGFSSWLDTCYIL